VGGIQETGRQVEPVIVVIAVVVVAFVAFVAYQARLVLRPEYDEYNATLDAAERWHVEPERTEAPQPERSPAVDERPDALTA
jgi:hypothetical protein